MADDFLTIFHQFDEVFPALNANTVLQIHLTIMMRSSTNTYDCQRPSWNTGLMRSLYNYTSICKTRTLFYSFLAKACN